MIKSIKKSIFFLIIISMSNLLTVSTVTADHLMINNAQENSDSAIARGFAYLHSQMNDDGGIRWIGESSSTAATIRVVQALAAAGYSQDQLISDSGNRPVDFLSIQGSPWVNQEESDTPGYSVARAGQLLTAVAAANQDPHNFGAESSDLIYELKAHYDPNTAIFGTAAEENVMDQVWAIIGLTANNASVPLEAAGWLASAQGEDGSWNDGFGGFLDTTPLAVLALIGSDHYEVESGTIQSALNFMKENQKSDGGWQTEWDDRTNANITGVMLQAISAIGQSPEDDIWQKTDGNPLTALLNVQGENGVFGGEFANAYSTADAIIGLMRRSITSLGTLQAVSEAFDFLIDLQGEDGGWRSVGQTIDVMLAFHAAGWQPNSVITGGKTPVEFMSENLEAYLESGPDAIGKTILAITSAGFDPMNFNGIDLSQRLLETYDESTLAFGSAQNTWHQAFTILGLHTANIEIPKGVLDTLVELQQEDGGWEYSAGFGSTSDSTALAVQVLHAGGYTKDNPIIGKALDYLKTSQTEDGGWGDSSTTAYALMTLNLLNEPADSWKTESGKAPEANLLTYQKSNGSFVYSWEYPEDSIMSTASALLAFFGGDYIVQASEIPQQNYAAVVVDPGEGQTQTACVAFSGESISGLDLLEESGFDYQADQDGFIESILNVSNPDGGTNYWSYWSWDGREWAFQNAGPAGSTVLPGTVEAWHLTSWEQYPSMPSEYIPDINEICGVDVLVDFQQQPYIDFNNLFQALSKGMQKNMVESGEPATEETQAQTGDITEEAAPDQSQTPLGTKMPEKTEERTADNLFPLPIVLIIGLGILTFGILAVLYNKYRK